MPYSTSDQCTGFKTFYLPQSQQQQWTGFPEPPLTCVNDMGSHYSYSAQTLREHPADGCA